MIKPAPETSMILTRLHCTHSKHSQILNLSNQTLTPTCSHHVILKVNGSKSLSQTWPFVRCFLGLYSLQLLNPFSLSYVRGKKGMLVPLGSAEVS